MQLSARLEELRAILFTGKPRRSLPSLTQPEYVSLFEQRIERDPQAEWKALHNYAKPLIPLYRQKLANIYKMESYILGKKAAPPAYDEETILTKIYEEIMELETEEEWQAWVRQWEV